MLSSRWLSCRVWLAQTTPGALQLNAAPPAAAAVRFVTAPTITVRGQGAATPGGEKSTKSMVPDVAGSAPPITTIPNAASASGSANVAMISDWLPTEPGHASVCGLPGCSASGTAGTGSAWPRSSACSASGL